MPASVHKCVDDVKGRKGVRSAWAVCVSSYKKKHGGKAPNMHPTPKKVK